MDNNIIVTIIVALIVLFVLPKLTGGRIGSGRIGGNNPLNPGGRQNPDEPNTPQNPFTPGGNDRKPSEMKSPSKGGGNAGGDMAGRVGKGEKPDDAI